MIGPHEGKELALMLVGEKSLAMFHDAIPDNDEIAEEIIPEEAFAPHVAAGTIKRFSKDIESTRKGGVIRFVCFTLPNEEWRAEYLLWFKSERFSRRLDHDPAHDEIIGKLLGYTDGDVQEFLSLR